jgi:oligopeptide transport system ATP-binding protein
MAPNLSPSLICSDADPAGLHPACPVLSVRSLAVRFRSGTRETAVVHDVSFSVRSGETLAIVGESGSGKSVTSLAIMRLTPPPPACRISGEVLFRGRDGSVLDLQQVSDAAIRQVRGDGIAMIFQEPMTSLNPLHTIGDQIAEAIVLHRRVGRRAARERATALLDRVGIPDARRRLDSYPHQLSGGMRQRAMIAMALSCDPVLLIADEPTTALDVTIQAQILDVLRSLQQERGMAVIFITHNLGVVAEIADRVAVFYAGRVVEVAPVAALFARPLMPYTMGLLRAAPRLDQALARGRLATIPGSVPDPSKPASGCAFMPRCEHASAANCQTAVPPLVTVDGGRQVRCARLGEIHGITAADLVAAAECA